jgi:hypothetical protein
VTPSPAVLADAARPPGPFAQALDAAAAPKATENPSQPSDGRAGCMCDALAAVPAPEREDGDVATSDTPTPELVALDGMVARWLAEDPAARASTSASSTPPPTLREIRADDDLWRRFTGWVHHVGAPHTAADVHPAASQAADAWAASLRADQVATLAAQAVVLGPQGRGRPSP